MKMRVRKVLTILLSVLLLLGLFPINSFGLDFTANSPVTAEVVKAFEDGVTLADGQLMKSATIIPYEDGYTAKIILHQGVYHQIKRMLGVFDIGVNTLHRTTIGSLELPQNLQPGEYIKLSPEQVAKITNNMFTEN